MKKLPHQREKTFCHIPFKTEHSLSQSRNGCVQALPSPIFHLMQPFLSEWDYRQFLNSSLLLFQQVKFETVCYTFKGPERWKKIDGFPNNLARKEYFKQLLGNVKDKSKQILIHLSHPSPKSLKDNADILRGLRGLTLHSYWQLSFSNCGFSVFSNIQHLILKDIGTIESFPVDLSGVVVLEIINWNNLKDISSLGAIPSLAKVCIIQCFQLGSVEVLKNMLKVKISECVALQDFSSLGNHQKLSVSTQYSLSSIQLDTFKRIQELTLRCPLPLCTDSYRSVKDISFLSLINFASHISNLPCLPFLLGKVVCLENFNLILWNEQESETMEILELVRCTELSHFPFLRNVHSLKIQDDSNQTHFPFLSSLKQLFFIRYMQLIDFSLFLHISFLFLNNCPCVTDVSILGAIPKLFLINCNGITSLEGLGNHGNSDVLLSSCLNITDFSPLKSLWKLHLDMLPQLEKAAAVDEVAHLTISRCEHFTDPGELHKLRSLTIADCSSLAHLTGVKHIIQLTVVNCSALKSFSEIGNHLKAVFSNYPGLVLMHKEFRKSTKYSEIFGTIVDFQIDLKGLYSLKYEFDNSINNFEL
jgi:hypothetical protein